jgi:type III pantothenate kinase
LSEGNKITGSISAEYLNQDCQSFFLKANLFYKNLNILFFERNDRCMDKKLLAIDIGNSNIVTGIWQHQEWTQIWRFSSHPPHDDKHYYAHALYAKMAENKIDGSEITDIVISSVVPSLNVLWMKALKIHFGVVPLLIGNSFFSKLKMGIIAPGEIGTDIVSNAYAAYKRYSFDTIILDFGTALTCTTISKTAGIIGVSIAPGLKTATLSLFKGTAQLPEVPLIFPDSVLGKNTVEAIQSGVLIGYVGLIKHTVETIRNELKQPLPVIATGGLSSILKPLEYFFYEIDPNLTLDGMRFIYEAIKD